MADGGQDKRVYIFDASAWIAADGDPMSNRIRDLLETLLADGCIKSPRQVFGELVRSGVYSEWAKTNRRKITYPPRMNRDYAANVGLVQHTFPAMGQALGVKERADPWVVAAALTEMARGQDCCVITTETGARRPNRKIRGVCEKLGLPCKTLTEWLNEQDEQ